VSAVHVVVAVKGLERGKHRLAGVLTQAERQQLITTMLHDVLDAVRATAGIANVSVLSKDRSLLPEGVEHLDDPGLGLNPAIARAAHLLASAGARSMLLLPADLPFVTPDDLGALLTAAGNHDAVIAPDAQRSGTNALLLSPPQRISPLFGLQSFAAHVAASRDVGLSAHVVDRPGLAHDIDVPADLLALVDKAGGRYNFLAAALRQAS
jgi:2-phospho-L-lactate/phosphoenolpyruvate guanylyltransferase